ncbi:MAG: DUF4242 domain-containing protein [Bacteroidales bacterium]|nr:DUF4242 domain-containing protein [Bacteroidales bacterium]MCF8455979.1 DUF4242 domain-containing protein [Bacteroidales bacterium]
MPIYMDRHDVSEEVTAENVANLHQQDLLVQHEFDCRGLTYWFDEKRKTAFCLVEAPNDQAIHDMHNHAHGSIPHSIIEVDARIVESFLGRIEDPEKSKNTDLNIINDPAFRTIMMFRVKLDSLIDNELINSNAFFETLNSSIMEKLEYFNGRIVKQDSENMLVSFDSVSNAVNCAVQLQSIFRGFVRDNSPRNIVLKIGLSSGVPVTGKKAIFEDSLKLSERMCFIANVDIIVSNEVKNLYKSENLNSFINEKWVLALSTAQEKFLTQFMDFVEDSWRDPEIKVDDFGKALGLSKSQIYRTMMILFDQSPNIFLREYRLSKALELLRKQSNNISETAFEAGFSSPSYFSKCFQKRYGIIPSEYIQRIDK